MLGIYMQVCSPVIIRVSTELTSQRVLASRSIGVDEKLLRCFGAKMVRGVNMRVLHIHYEQCVPNQSTNSVPEGLGLYVVDRNRYFCVCVCVCIV